MLAYCTGSVAAIFVSERMPADQVSTAAVVQLMLLV